MRLTLRTLLSYLDDMLEPAQAKAIGGKVAESEQARDLIERIKQVTRRRRLTSPPTTGPGGMDSNTIAEYLDNEVTPEKAQEVENICLASDVHLAEVAACHQILTLVLGEPALVPPSAKQRMYGLVKGPESIPFRKPAKAASKDDNDLSSEIEPDRDETLRLGLPAVGGKGSQRNFFLLVGGGVLAACLLVFAIWQFTHTPSDIVPEPKGNGKDQLAQGDKDGKKKDQDNKDDDKKKKDPVANDKDGTKPPVKNGEEPKGKKQSIPIESVKIENPVDIPYQPANMKQMPVGKYQAPGIKQPAVLLQAKNDKATSWERIADKDAPVSSGKPLLSLSGSKSVINLDTGIELTLWGNLPEETLDFLTLESRVILHASGQLDADLTLERGRIILRNKKGGKDGFVRVRFNNPTQGAEEHLDIILEGSESAVILERYGEMDREEPFFEDPKDKGRKGPIAYLRVFARDQVANVRMGDAAFRVEPKSQPMLNWRSREGVLGPPEKSNLPPWFNGMPTVTKDDKLAREKAIAAHKALAAIMTKKPIDVALAEIMQTVQQNAEKENVAAKKISIDTFTLWRHAIRCSAAVDGVGYLFEEFNKENTPIFVRGLCMQTIQSWLTWDRDRDYQLLDVLRINYRKTESIKIMELFHMISTADARRPATYQRLIEGLNNDIPAIRTLSHWHLIGLAPAGGAIIYDPSMPAQLREGAIREWSRLIPPGQLPMNAAPKKKKDKK